MGSRTDPIGQTLIQRLQDEADLCRNEGADDIAALLDEAAEALKDSDWLRARLDSAHEIVQRQTAALREADARYMALLKSVAEGEAMRPRQYVINAPEAWPGSE